MSTFSEVFLLERSILMDSGDPDGEVYEPRFTVHGFRYVEIQNLWHPPSLDDVVGVVVHSTAPKAGNFSSSNIVLNQIQHNIGRVAVSRSHGFRMGPTIQFDVFAHRLFSKRRKKGMDR